MRNVVSILVLMMAMISAPALAQSSVTDIYRGKIITIIVGFSAGGGYDLYTRLLARHYGRHIAGNPEIIVQNMPGAGSLTAVRYLDVRAAQDGATIAAFNPGLLMETLLDPDKNRFSFMDVAWLGSIARDFRVCYAWHAKNLNSWDEIAKLREFNLGSTGAGSSAYINGAMLRNIFGLPIHQVVGYPGSAEQRIAVERGELDGDCGTWSAITPEWRASNKVKPFIRFSDMTAPDFPAGVPFILDYAKSPAQKELVTLLIKQNELGVPYALSKQVPAGRVAILRAAFDETMKDSQFQAEAEKLQFPVDPVGGADAERITREIYSASPELVAKAREAVN
jgi:tripartite-type tricarboxylate transporter receptor subunit TctC